MRARLTAAIAALALCACGTTTLGQPATPSGPAGAINVSGTFDRGPAVTCPAGEPCDPPAVALSLVFSPATGSAVTVRIGPDGSFALHLEPGDYAIAAEPPVFGGAVEPASVRVPATGEVVLSLRVVRSP